MFTCDYQISDKPPVQKEKIDGIFKEKAIEK